MNEHDRQRLEDLTQAHHRLTGRPAEQFFQAPGRVNLLGEHTDQILADVLKLDAKEIDALHGSGALAPPLREDED